MLAGFALVAFLFLFPWLALWLERNTRVFGFLGSVVTCYLGGIVLANAAELGALVQVSIGRPDMDIAKPIMGVSILASVPLLLFTAHFRQWLRHARTSVLAFLLICVTVVFSSIVWWFPFRHLPESTRVAGMLVGVFTGGSVNLNAIGIALGTSPETIVLASTAEMLSSVVFMFLTLSFGQRFALRFLPAYTSGSSKLEGGNDKPVFRMKAGGWGLLLALVVAGLALGMYEGIVLSLVAGGLKPELVKEMQLPLAMLLVTALGVGVSLTTWRRKLEGSQPVGDYLLLVFSTAFGTLVQVGTLLARGEAFMYLGYATLVCFTAVGLHYVLCWRYRVDADTTIIAQVAGIQSAPFIGMFIDALKNREILLSGLTSAIAGYAVGNYLGILVHYILQFLQPYLA